MQIVFDQGKKHFDCSNLVNCSQPQGHYGFNYGQK